MNSQTETPLNETSSLDNNQQQQVKATPAAATLQRRENKLVVFLMVLAFACFPSFAAAAPWDGALQKAIDLLNGTTMRLLAILALMVVGIMSMRGRIPWGIAGSIICGIIFMFGAAWIADTFIGSVEF